MDTNDFLELSDRQARAVILAAEALGFEREPDLPPNWYHHDLHDDARYAVDYLRARDGDALRAALVADEPIAPGDAARCITETGHFSFGHVELVVEAATRLGFVPPTEELPLLDDTVKWNQGTAAVAFLWERDPAQLTDLLGDIAQIAPLPSTARVRSTWFESE
jgi:hypothetical protein